MSAWMRDRRRSSPAWANGGDDAARELERAIGRPLLIETGVEGSYFESSHNVAATAAALGVHHQTVANRVRAVEETLGAPVASRRAELELALRLRRCFEKPPSLQAGLQNEGYLP